MRNRTFKVKQDWSLLNRNIYIMKRRIPRKRSTFSRKKVLKDRKLKFDSILKDVVYSGGLANSIDMAKHLILTGNIKLNGSIITSPGLNIKSGDIITSTDPKSLLWYYIQRWNSIKLNPSLRNNKKLDGKTRWLIRNLKKIDFKIKDSTINDIQGNITGWRYTKLLSGDYDRNDVLGFTKGKASNKILKRNRRFKKFKFMIPNSRIHKLSFNTIMYI